MALTYVKNATAARVFYNGLGVEFHEKFVVKGEERVAKYTAWFEENPGISEGAVGTVSGLTGVKARIWTPEDGEPRAMADIVLNNARFEPSDDAGDDSTPW